MSVFTQKGTKPILDKLKRKSVSIRIGNFSRVSAVFSKDSFKASKTSQKSVLVKLDSRCRISIPSFLRKNFNWKGGDNLKLLFDLKEGFFIVQNSVADSIEGCGPSGAGSTPASGPKLKGFERRVYER